MNGHSNLFTLPGCQNITLILHHRLSPPVPGRSCLILELNLTAADVRNLPRPLLQQHGAHQHVVLKRKGRREGKKTNACRSRCLQHALPSYRMTEWLLYGDMKSNWNLSEIPFKNAVKKNKSRGDPQWWRHTYTLSVAGCQSGYLYWRLTFHCCSFALPQFGCDPLYENSSSSWLTCSENNETLCHFHPWELRAAVHTAFLYWLAPRMGQSNLINISFFVLCIL